MSVRHLQQLLEPASVVVVGASNRVGSVGGTVWRNLHAGQFKGPIFGVNPKHTELDGKAIHARIADLPQAPDLAVLCTPPDTVAGLIDALGQLGTRAAVVMTAGLSPAQKQTMLDAARPHLLRVLGPNCLGLLSPRLGLNASFAHIDSLAGDVAFVSQSGALVTAVLDWATTRRIGFSHMVSLGESAAVDFGDLLDHLASDPRTRAILLYIESIKAPRKFMSAARAAARNKRVIVVKAGRAGRLRVDTLQDLFMAAATLARFRGGEAGGPAAGIAPGPSPASKPLPGLARGLRGRTHRRPNRAPGQRPMPHRRAAGRGPRSGGSRVCSATRRRVAANSEC